MATSRRGRHRMRESRRQMYVSVSIIVLLVVLMLTFGARIIEFIGNAALLIRGDEGEVARRKELSIIQTPTLENLPDATSDEEIVVNGRVGEEGGIVELYINDNEYDSQRLSDDTNFSFDVRLEEGENIIQAKYLMDERESEFSRSRKVTFLNEAPVLEDISPSDGQEFGRGDQRIEVSGKTDPESKVSVNGFRAFVENDGSFSYFLSLNEGDNTISIVATNKAGLESTEEITVRYSP